MTSPDSIPAALAALQKLAESSGATDVDLAAAIAKLVVDAAPTPAPAETAAPADAGEFRDNAIVQKLGALGIPSRTYAHTLSMTAEDLVANVPLSSANAIHTKNLFFKDKKHGLFLITVAPDAHVNTKAVAKELGLTGKVNMRMGPEDVLMEKLGCAKGCVGPLAMANDADHEVTFVFDAALLADAGIEEVHSHPLRNDASTVVAPADLMAYFEKCGVEVHVQEFAKKGDAPAVAPAASSKGKPKDKPKPAKGQGKAETKPGANKKKVEAGKTLLAMQWKKTENFPMWYSDVIVLSEMISYYDISGCYILRPWSYKMWELVQDWFNGQIRPLGVENSYFPMFVSQDRLEKEKDHVEGFAPEVAWVTRSGDSELAKPIAVRPTSETIMYPAFADWIKSHRDLPLKLNQWSNVVRWEFKDPTPFLRTREFLWQEGHTAHATYDESQVMVRQALELYRRVYEELMAVPVIPGYKTEKEKFAGGHQTTTVEAYIPGSGRAIQGATSHNLGQNFGKMFDISFQDEQGTSKIAWQTSWGLTTRTLGVCVMVHGDDTGLVLPPAVAPLQAIIVPIISKKCTFEQVTPYCESILKQLEDAGIRAKYDDRDVYNPGWKYNHWEQKGVPIRIEVGPRDIEQGSVRLVLRYSGEKSDHKVEGIGDTVKSQLDFIQADMLAKAKETRDSHLVKITEWEKFVPELEKHNLVLTPWCGGEHQEWEEWVKTKSREETLKDGDEEDERTATSVAAKTLCIPFDQPELPQGTKCIASGLPATCWVLWGRSY